MCGCISWHVLVCVCVRWLVTFCWLQQTLHSWPSRICINPMANHPLNSFSRCQTAWTNVMQSFTHTCTAHKPPHCSSDTSRARTQSQLGQVIPLAPIHGICPFRFALSRCRQQSNTEKLMVIKLNGRTTTVIIECHFFAVLCGHRLWDSLRWLWLNCKKNRRA